MDKNLLPAIIGALSGAFVAAVGWFVLHGLSLRRESAARRDLESGMIPRSFEDFFLHEVQFEALHMLWKAHGVDSSIMSGHGWPLNFEADVRTVLEELRARHQVFLRRTGATQ